MRHIEASGEELRGCGSGILPGLRRFCGTICFFVVNTSHIGSFSSGMGVEEAEEAPRRDFLSDEAAADKAVVLMWERSAVEALRSYVLLIISERA